MCEENYNKLFSERTRLFPFLQLLIRFLSFWAKERFDRPVGRNNQLN